MTSNKRIENDDKLNAMSVIQWNTMKLMIYSAIEILFLIGENAMCNDIVYSNMTNTK